MLLFFFFFVVAFAEDASPDAEITVFGDFEISEKRQQLHQKLEDLGYAKQIRKKGKTVYVPQISWKPTVIVYDSGYIKLKRTPPRIKPNFQYRANLGYLPCLVPPFTLTCIDTGGWLVGQRKLAHSKAKVIEQTRPLVEKWQQAIQKQAHEFRLYQQLPIALEKIWRASDRTAKQKRLTIINFWASRTCTPEGDEARLVIEEFMSDQIETSETPFSQQEIHNALTENKCGETQLLDRRL